MSLIQWEDKAITRPQRKPVTIHTEVKLWDDIESDGTDGAHPAYWRGQDQAFVIMSQQLQDVLNGKKRFGACQEPWNSLLKHVESLVAERDALKTFTKQN